MANIEDIPEGSVLGLNYSGAHDSAIAVVAPSGRPVFAISLERLSRVKQDGRPPFAILEKFPWDKIETIAVSTDSEFHFPSETKNSLLETRLPVSRKSGLLHASPFYDFLKTLPSKKEYVSHQLSHASSAFWASGFDNALCLTYDGGMFNSPWFGGLFTADRNVGIKALEQFNALEYSKVTSLYTFVTAVLGFSPNKHEGKITGLAAYGQPSKKSRALIRKWFEKDALEIESVMEWAFLYDSMLAPVLMTNNAKIKKFREEASEFTNEDLAATTQEFTEQHVLGILKKALDKGWGSNNICLAGGLFANVKLNQAIVELGYDKVFICPPMTDEGSALGAAYHVLASQKGGNLEKLQSVYLGPSYTKEQVEEVLANLNIIYTTPDEPDRYVADVLASGAVVAVFQGAMEFGPRALGNRSILASATESDINHKLNERLNRTEFMPFAPVTRIEDAELCYQGLAQVWDTAEFMTVTVNCTDFLQNTCPAVVHVDGTARPQLVKPDINSFVHSVLTHYKHMTGNCALVNTSFNIHEEPIVCSPEDAIQGFLEAGLDYLYLEGGIVVSYQDNKKAALRYSQNAIRKKSQKLTEQAEIIRLQQEKLLVNEHLINEKEAVINELVTALKGNNYNRTIESDEQFVYPKGSAVQALSFSKKLPRSILRPLRRIIEIFTPRLGQLYQYAYPRPLSVKQKLNNQEVELSSFPKISIVTPSFEQANFIDKTIESVLNQNYPNLEYFIQDGGSSDGTIEILEKYDCKLAGWCSEPDTGQSQAINRGFTQTSGEIMAWLNSDDLLLPAAINTVVDYFNKNPEVDVVYGDRLMIDDEDREIGRWMLPGHDSETLKWADYVPQETLFWRRSLWEKVGGEIDESFKFAMDWDLLIRFSEAGAKFSHIPKFLGAFRIHQQQKTSSLITEIGTKEMDRIRKRIHGYTPNSLEIKKNVMTYLIKHVFTDLKYRIKRLRRSSKARMTE